MKAIEAEGLSKNFRVEDSKEKGMARQHSSLFFTHRRRKSARWTAYPWRGGGGNTRIYRSERCREEHDDQNADRNFVPRLAGMWRCLASTRCGKGGSLRIR